MVTNPGMHALALRAAHRRRDVISLALVFLLIYSFIWGWRTSFHGATAVFATALIGLLLSGYANLAGSFRDAGFRLDTTAHAAALLAPMTGLIIAVVVLAGHLLGSIDFPTPHDAWASLSEAFAFGLAQQYVLPHSSIVGSNGYWGAMSSRSLQPQWCLQSFTCRTRFLPS